MATKKELFEATIAACEKYNAPKELVAELTTLLEPKRGGAQFSIEEVTCQDSEGQVTHIFDTVFGAWMPLYDKEGEPNFYEKPDTELGWSRFSRAGEKSRKDREKVYKASKDAILSDLLSGEIDQLEAQSLMQDAEKARKKVVIPEEASKEKPC